MSELATRGSCSPRGRLGNRSFVSILNLFPKPDDGLITAIDLGYYDTPGTETVVICDAIEECMGVDVASPTSAMFSFVLIDLK